MPHKDAAAEAMDRLSDDAQRLHAVNTVVLGADGMTGHNTDAPGFDRFLRRDAGFEPAGRTALLFGAGGAARACALALARAELARLTVAVREPARADRLLAALEGLGTAVDVVPIEEAPSRPADLIVNATPAELDVSLPLLGEETLVIDVRYEPPVTALHAAALAAGATAFGGLGMLLHQAALSFELWTGRPAPLEVMSAAALAASAGRG